MTEEEGGQMAEGSSKRVNEGVGKVFHEVIDVDCEVPASENATKDSQQSAARHTATSFLNRTRTYWEPPMDRHFVNSMLAHVQKGNRIRGKFTREAWTDMISSFNAKFDFECSVEILKNRYKSLRRQYHVIKNLLDMDGFVWDEERKIVTAEDCLWQEYVKRHKDARQFMTRPVPYYKDLCVIYEPSSDEIESSLSRPSDLQNVAEDVSILGVPKTVQSAATSNPDEGQVSDVQSGQKLKRQLENFSDSSCPKKSKDGEQGMATALQDMATVVSSICTNKNDDSSVIENAIEAVQALPDTEEDLILDACDFLEDEKKAKTFLALDVKLRKKWLVRKLRPKV